MDTAVSPPSAGDVSPSPATGASGSLGGLSRAERAARTRDLLVLAAADPANRAELLDSVIVINCRVADAVAARYRGRGVPLEDLRQAAYEGLVKAVHRFDPALAAELLTFAVPVIRGEVQRHFRDRSWMIRPPRHAQEVSARVRAGVEQLTEDLGREPSVGEVCDYLDLDLEEYYRVKQTMAQLRCDSLDREVGEEGTSMTLADTFSATGGDAGGDALSIVEALAVLTPAVHRLSPIEGKVVYLSFYEERTQHEIGIEVGRSQTQVGRILQRALLKLRAAIDSPDVADRTAATVEDGPVRGRLV